MYSIVNEYRTRRIIFSTIETWVTEVKLGKVIGCEQIYKIIMLLLGVSAMYIKPRMIENKGCYVAQVVRAQVAVMHPKRNGSEVRVLP